MKRSAIAIISALLLSACGGGSGGGGSIDGGSDATSGGGDSGTDAARDGSRPGSDAGPPTACVQGDTCAGGLQCLCCGSAGPRAICVCTTPCADESACSDPARTSCNKPSPGAASGICTNPGFNCCWGCQ